MAQQRSEILTSAQLRLLTALSARLSERFAPRFTGGAALSAVYLQHRLSEDIDLVFKHCEEDVATIADLARKVIEELNGIILGDYRRSTTLHQFDCEINKERLKVDLMVDKVRQELAAVIWEGIATESVLGLAMNKIDCIYSRTSSKEFVDLYFLIQDDKVRFAELLEYADGSIGGFDRLQFAALLLQSQSMEVLPVMVREFDLESFREFYRDLYKKVIRSIPPE